MRFASRHAAMPDDGLRAIIVDDEELARRGVRQQLERHPEVRVVAECATAAQAARAIATQDLDLVFLDIQMPGGSGFDVVNEIGVEPRPAIIFVTAYSEHALRAFEVNAVDYVLKPVDDVRFDQALERAQARLRSASSDDFAERVRAAVQAIADVPIPVGSKGTHRVPIHDGNKTLLVRVDDIEWLEAAGNYVRIHYGRRTVLTRATLNSLSALIQDSRFIRVHRSAIVNCDAIVQIEAAGKGLYVLGLRDGNKVEASYHYRSAVAGLLKPR